MKRSQVIQTLKDPIKNVMQKVGKNNINPTFASEIISFSLYLYDKKEITDSAITDKNNPVAMKDPSTGELLSFNSIEECLLQYVANKETPKDIEDFNSKYDGICKAYNLYKIDKELLQGINGSIIDLPDEKKEPKIDLYTVKDERGNIVAKFQDKKEATKVADTIKKSTVTNSRNKIINGTKVVAGTTSMITTAITPGAKIILSGMNLYYKAKDTRPGRVIDGEYYIYDGKVVNGRYAICVKPEFAAKVPTAIIGWINVKDIKK